MKIIIRGVRGSIPTSGHDIEHYGGNTSCVEITADGWRLILDAGSGMRNLDAGNKIEKRVDILLTHLHLDHIIGLGFFQPLFNPKMEVHIWGPGGSTRSLLSRLMRYLSPPLFPVHIRSLPCKLILHEIENSLFEIGPFKIQSEYVIHPGPTVGFRITSHQAVFTYIPDHEPALGKDGILSDSKWVSGINLAAGADLLLHDSQFSVAEYQDRMGWGHSSIEDALLFASMANIKQLLLAHHDPSHTDVQLNALFNTYKKKNDYPFQYELAAEGMEFELP